MKATSESWLRRWTWKSWFHPLLACRNAISTTRKAGGGGRNQYSGPYLHLSFLHTVILSCLIEVILTPRSTTTYVRRRRRRKAKCYVFDCHKLLLSHSNSSVQEVKLWLCGVPHPHPKLITYFCTKNNLKSLNGNNKQQAPYIFYHLWVSCLLVMKESWNDKWSVTNICLFFSVYNLQMRKKASSLLIIITIIINDNNNIIINCIIS